MLKVADLKKYAERVGIIYPPTCRSKKMTEIIAKAIEVSVDDLEKIIKHVNNQKQFKEEIKKLLVLSMPLPKPISVGDLYKYNENVVKPEIKEVVKPEIKEVVKPFYIKNLSNNKYEIEGLILPSSEEVEITKELQKNKILVKTIKYHIELNKFRIV